MVRVTPAGLDAASDFYAVVSRISRTAKWATNE